VTELKAKLREKCKSQLECEKNKTNYIVHMDGRQNSGRQDEFGTKREVIGSISPVLFSPSEHLAIEEFSDGNLHPHVFVLVMLTALCSIRQQPVQNLCVSTQEVLRQVRNRGKGLEMTIRTNFLIASSLGLLYQKDIASDEEIFNAQWAITSDGKRFLMNGIRIRVHMRKFVKSDEDIFEQLAVEEIDEWRQEIMDLSKTLALGDGQIDLQCRTESQSVALDRGKYAERIAAQKISQVKQAQVYFGPLWATLLY